MMKNSKLGGINYNDENKAVAFEGGYEPSEYANLPVSSDIK